MNASLDPAQIAFELYAFVQEANWAYQLLNDEEAFDRARNAIRQRFKAGAARSLEAVERDHIRAVLEQTGWVVEGAKGAAKILSLNPNTLRSRMKKLGIMRSNRPAGPTSV